MELSRKEEYKNQKVSIGVTLFSFIVMLLFFIYTNIITAGSSSVRTGLPAMSIGMDNSNPDNTDQGEKTVQLVSAKQETASHREEIASPYGESIPLQTINGEKNTPEISNVSGEKFTDAGRKDAKFGFDLPERNMVTAPDFTNNTKEQGKVIVDVVVDQQGNVIEADPNGRGTTTSSADLKAEARRMALAVKFNQNQKTEEQRGTITIIFSFD